MVKRVGSGGATFNVLKYIAEQDGDAGENHFRGKLDLGDPLRRRQ